MKVEIVAVTPRMARDWLKSNTANRPIRPSHVETLRASFERGEYAPTHQGIAFDDKGVLIDGQHRLTAISMMADAATFMMLVTRGLDRPTAFPVIDATQAKRSTGDVLGISSGMGEAANFLAKLYAGRTTGITPSYARPFVDFIADDFDDLKAFCPRTVQTWSAARRYDARR